MQPMISPITNPTAGTCALLGFTGLSSYEANSSTVMLSAPESTTTLTSLIRASSPSIVCRMRLASPSSWPASDALAEISIAFCCPTTTTICRARVSAVYSSVRLSASAWVVVRTSTTAGYSAPCALCTLAHQAWVSEQKRLVQEAQKAVQVQRKRFQAAGGGVAGG